MTTTLGKDVDGVTRLELVQRYIRDYFAALSGYGYNVIQSLPYLTRPDVDFSSYAFTSIDYRVIASKEITIKNCMQKVNPAEAPALLIYGMLGGRPMPDQLIQWITSFIIAGKRNFGTVCFNKQIFLEGNLLKRLELVNRRTTLVPKFAGVIDGKSHFDLCAWGDDQYRSKQLCNWRRTQAPEGVLAYIWEHRDEWSHEHEGTDEKSGEYSLQCEFHKWCFVLSKYSRGTFRHHEEQALHPDHLPGERPQDHPQG